MAKITPHGLSGTIGKITYYVQNGQQYGKGVPIRVRQTEATKASASKFGVAAGCARRIRERITQFLTPLNHLTLRNRLTSAVYEWIQVKPTDTGESLVPISPLIGFDFNEQSPMRKYMTSKIQVDWSGPGIARITIPAIDPVKDIKAPRYTSSIDLWLSTTNFLINKESSECSRVQMIQIPYREGVIAPKELEFNIKLVPDSINVLSMGLRYNVPVTGAVLPEKSPKWLPATIIDAVYKGNPVQ